MLAVGVRRALIVPQVSAHWVRRVGETPLNNCGRLESHTFEFAPHTCMCVVDLNRSYDWFHNHRNASDCETMETESIIMNQADVGPNNAVHNLSFSTSEDSCLNLRNCINVSPRRLFRTVVCFLKDRSSNIGKSGSKDKNVEDTEAEEQEWVHPDLRSDSILEKDAELKSMLRELASDFGRDMHGEKTNENVDSVTEEQMASTTEERKGTQQGVTGEDTTGHDLKMNMVLVEDTEESLEPIDMESEKQSEKRFVFSIDDLVSILREENAQDICVINIPQEKRYVDYFVVVTGKSPRHLRAMTLHINQQYKSRKEKADPFVLVEGDDTDDWMCIDFGNIVLHLMSEECREFYELEKLWLLGPEYDDQLRRLKEYEVRMKDTLDLNIGILDPGPKTNAIESENSTESEGDGGDDGKPEISFAR